MEAAPLTKAHTFARAASTYTQKGNLPAAQEAHEQAAAEFTAAKASTKDPEALRILTLLEAQHFRLAKLIAIQLQPPVESEEETPHPQTNSDPKSANSTEPAATTTATKQDDASATTTPKRTPSPSLTRRTAPHRNPTSSIANNLATARGKPSTQRRALPINPEVTPQHAGGSMVARTNLQQPNHLQTLSTSPSKSTRSTPSRPPAANASQPAKKSAHESFASFLNTFENLYSKLSAPLAFTGLPLLPDDSPSPPPPPPPPTSSSQKRSTGSNPRRTDRATAHPDLTTLFSAPALRVIKEDAGAGFGSESFCVVPPSGGTLSYAGMLGRGESELSNVTEGGEDEEFVDARESLGPPSPGEVRGKRGWGLRSGGKGSSASTPSAEKSRGGKTMEELELENKTLRQLLDKQSQRLTMWETTSQSQSLALAQSLRLTRMPGSGGVGEGTAGGKGGEGGEVGEGMDRLRELEELVRQMQVEKDTLEHQNMKAERENEKLLAVNEKLLAVLGRYREKWETLKQGARARRAAGQGSATEGGRA